MMKKKLSAVMVTVCLLLGGVTAAADTNISQAVITEAKTIIKYDHSAQNSAHRLEKQNDKIENNIIRLNKKTAKLRKQLKKYTNGQVESVSEAKLARLNYSGQDIITVNNNNPSFSSSDLNTSRGAWQRYSNLDSLNRVTAANALLNQSLMPHSRRQPLNVDPTGWHNKRIGSGWLYNRCHLIGFQLTGQNNNWKNLMTGTRQLNDPDMLRYEDEVADYLNESRRHYVRYRVTPIFRGSELLARGIEIEAQSAKSNAVHFNVYIFNVEQSVKIDYATGRSRVK